MKDVAIAKAEEIAFEKYGKELYELTEEQQSEVWKLAEEAAQDYLAGQIDTMREREKEKYGGSL